MAGVSTALSMIYNETELIKRSLAKENLTDEIINGIGSAAFEYIMKLFPDAPKTWAEYASGFLRTLKLAVAQLEKAGVT